MAAVTQLYVFAAYTGRPYGSFAGKTATAVASEPMDASFVAECHFTHPHHCRRHHFPEHGSYVGAQLLRFLNLPILQGA